MPPSTLENEAPLAEGQGAMALPGRTVLIVVAGVMGAWLAAGSLGWMAPALAKVLIWAALGVAIAAAWPGCSGAKAHGTLLAAAAVALLLTALAMPVVSVLAVVILLVVIADTQSVGQRQALLTVALAVATLAVFRMACHSATMVWATADAVARFLGHLAGWIAGRPLVLGPSFAGLDFLVLMAALWLGWVARPRAAASGGTRRAAASAAAAAIVLVHMAYLLLPAWSSDLATARAPSAAWSPAVPPPATEVSHLGFWSWSHAVRAWLPWGLPALAAIGQAAVAAAMLRFARWPAPADIRPASAGPGSRPVPARPLNILAPSAFGLLPPVLAVASAMVLLLDVPRPDLKGLRMLAYQTGGIQWDVPAEDQPAAAAAPSFGLLRPLVESLGGQLDRSSTLAESELAEHNVLLLLPPGPKALASWMAPDGTEGGEHEPLFAADLQVRILDFVRRGGTLLLAAAPEHHPGAIENVFNELLGPTGIRVADETACSGVPCWEENVEAAAPAVRGGQAGPGLSFGLDRPARLQVAWPAAPLLIGRWGWGDPGAGASHASAYRPGERLGDLVLAAGRRLGRGRVVVLADAGCLSDRQLPSSHGFITRLLALLAADSDGPLAPWRQWLGLAALAGFLGLVAWRPGGAGSQARTLAVAAGVLAAAVAGCTLASNAGAGSLLPEGRPQSARPLVYVDASHLPAAASQPEQDDGLGQWTEILARDGYLPLWAPDLSPARLEAGSRAGAGAPARPLDATERETVRAFVEGGGSLAGDGGGGGMWPQPPAVGRL